MDTSSLLCCADVDVTKKVIPEIPASESDTTFSETSTSTVLVESCLFPKTLQASNPDAHNQHQSPDILPSGPLFPAKCSIRKAMSREAISESCSPNSNKASPKEDTFQTVSLKPNDAIDNEVTTNSIHRTLSSAEDHQNTRMATDVESMFTSEGAPSDLETLMAANHDLLKNLYSGPRRFVLKSSACLVCPLPFEYMHLLWFALPVDASRSMLEMSHRPRLTDDPLPLISVSSAGVIVYSIENIKLIEK